MDTFFYYSMLNDSAWHIVINITHQIHNSGNISFTFQDLWELNVIVLMISKPTLIAIYYRLLYDENKNPLNEK